MKTHLQNRVKAILLLAFKENNTVNFLVKQGHKKLKRLENLIEYSIHYGERFGKIYLAEDELSCAILIDKDKVKFSFSILLLKLKLIFKTIGVTRVYKIIKHQNKITCTQPKANNYHLWYLGVLPTQQGKGKGSALLNKILLDCKEKPIYLETSIPDNFKFYESQGFEELKTIVFEEDITLKIYRSSRAKLSLKTKNTTENFTAHLTPTEINVAKSILEGKTFKEIAYDLNIECTTATKHGSNIYKKAGCKSKKELINILHQAQWLQREQQEYVDA